MPKDEFDRDDPFQLNGVALRTHEDTTDAMAACFIEEFLRMGHRPEQVLALFRNPHYVGPHLVCATRGEPFVRELIADIVARWGIHVRWPDADPDSRGETPCSSPSPDPAEDPLLATSAARVPRDAGLAGPLRAPVPKPNPKRP